MALISRKPRQNFIYLPGQLVGGEWLQDILIRARFYPGLDFSLLTLGGQKGNRDVLGGGLIFNAFTGFVSGHARHAHVQQHQIRNFFNDLKIGFLAVIDRDDFMAGEF